MDRKNRLATAALVAAALCTAVLLLAALGAARETGAEQRAAARLEAGIGKSEAARPLMQEAWSDARVRCLAVQD